MPSDDRKFLDFMAIESIVEENAGKILSAVSGFFTSCKRLNKRHQASEDGSQRTEVRKQKMRSGEGERLRRRKVGALEKRKDGRQKPGVFSDRIY